MREDDYTPYTARRLRQTARPVLWFRRNREMLHDLGVVLLLVGQVAAVIYLAVAIPDPIMFGAFMLLLLAANRRRG